MKSRGPFCEKHSCCLTVFVNGELGRFCQVCHTVHDLSNFKGTSRTCETWLSRRRSQRAARKGLTKQVTQSSGGSFSSEDSELCAVCNRNPAKETFGVRQRACASCETSISSNLSSAGHYLLGTPVKGSGSAKHAALSSDYSVGSVKLAGTPYTAGLMTSQSAAATSSLPREPIQFHDGSAEKLSDESVNNEEILASLESLGVQVMMHPDNDADIYNDALLLTNNNNTPEAATAVEAPVGWETVAAAAKHAD